MVTLLAWIAHKRGIPGFRFSELSSQPRFVNSSALMTHHFGESNRGQFHSSDRVLPSHKKLDFLTQREKYYFKVRKRNRVPNILLMTHLVKRSCPSSPFINPRSPSNSAYRYDRVWQESLTNFIISVKACIFPTCVYCTADIRQYKG